jgi:ubiquinone/menaquinone biosynthesis C-methylase UbiE
VRKEAVDNDKMRELIRYEQKARLYLDSKKTGKEFVLGSKSVHDEYRAPYEVFEKQILTIAKKGNRVLDLCCGAGAFSFISNNLGTSISVADISPGNVEHAVSVGRQNGIIISGKVTDAESLAFKNDSFDLITCAGGLSYFDRAKGLGEIRRVLSPGGHFICIDSLNHNPIYRLNRYIHYRRGIRTLSTLRRMPDMTIFTQFERHLGSVVNKSFHGCFAFLIPFLKPFIGGFNVGLIVDLLDKKYSFMHKYAFKFVAVVQKQY